MSKLMLTRTGTTVLKARRRYSRNRRPRRQSAPTVLQRSHYYCNGVSPGQSPTGLSHIPEFARMRNDLWRARSDPIQCRCDSLKANADYLRATSDMLQLKSDALRSKSEQICRKGKRDSESPKTLLLQSEELKSKAEQLRRESDALRAKMEQLRRESESAFVFPDFTTAPGGGFLHMRSSSPSNTLLLPASIPEVDTTPETARSIVNSFYLMANGSSGMVSVMMTTAEWNAWYGQLLRQAMSLVSKAT
ncbi:hypothetical protein Btru_014977 [Bulinus truncatus]|nr:hypothetical protein Btru_014977 [Bulinus truncatus]